MNKKGVIKKLSFLQHYQKDADGLCTRLKQAVDVSGPPPSIVFLPDFLKSMHC